MYYIILPLIKMKTNFITKLSTLGITSETIFIFWLNCFQDKCSTNKQTQDLMPCRLISNFQLKKSCSNNRWSCFSSINRSQFNSKYKQSSLLDLLSNYFQIFIGCCSRIFQRKKISRQRPWINWVLLFPLKANVKTRLDIWLAELKL